MRPDRIPNPFLSLAAASGFLAVALGAFGAHALRQRLEENAMAIYQTAVLYHMVHTLALLAVALLCRVAQPGPRLAGHAFSVGILLFCGSLYLLSVTGTSWLGAVTPLGGVGFLVGWGSLLYWSLGEAAR